VLFGALALRGGRLSPEDWQAALVTGFFQTTVNFGSTTMALAGGGAGRTAVLVFTMPFWTLLLAWPVLHERVRGLQWLAIALAFAGLAFVVEPWNWRGDLAPKLWAMLSGLGWAAGTVATKHYQRRRSLDMLNFTAWQMLLGVLPLTLVALAFDFPATHWSLAQASLLAYVGAVSTALGFLLWIAILRHLPAGTASLNMFAIPVIALVSSALVFGERLTGSEWTGIALIGAGLAIVTTVALRSSRRGDTALVAPVD
jgi:drug/metabolite transporter (DMT)-like permease